MFVDIADTTVPNLIYVLSSSQELSFKCWENLW